MNKRTIPPRFTFQHAAACRSHVSALRLTGVLLLALFAFEPVPAQSVRPDDGRSRSAHAVIAVAATDAGLRFTAPGEVIEMRLEVFSTAGEKIFDSDFRRGNMLDWSPAVAPTAGASAPTGDDYLCVLTLRDLSGRVRRRQGVASLAAGKVTLRAAAPARLGELTAGAEDEGEGLTFVGAGEAMVLNAHDGRDGQLTSTAGALTFRTGDLFRGAEREQMRITPDGRVGVGTDKPEATLDVAGAVRARGGFVFPDGSRLNSSGGKLSLTSAAGDEIPGPTAVGTGTANRIAKWAETGGAGTLTDSTFEEDASGNVFNFTGTRVVAPGQQPFFEAQRGSSGDILQRFWNTGAGGAKLRYVAGTGATSQIQLTDNVEWLSAIAGNNAIGLQFRVRAVGSTNSEAGLDSSAVMTLSRNGNVGVGVASPTAKLEVAGNVKLTGTGNGVIFPDGTKQTTASAGGVTGAGTTNTVPLWTGATALGNSVITQSGGSVGIGEPAPSAKLDVAGNIRASGSFIGASATLVGNLTVDVGTLHVDAANNRVGIGTTAPGVPLDVVGDINTSTQYKLGGVHALSNAGVDNLFAGAGAGAVNTGTANTFFGASAGASNTGGDDNSFFGRFAGSLNVNSNDNSFFGSNAGAANVNGFDNSFFGSNAGAANTSSGNSFFGSSAGAANTSGASNSFFGDGAGDANVSGTSNSFFGDGAGGANITTSFSSIFGAVAGSNNIGNSNSFFGWRAGWLNTTGSLNSFLGESAGSANTTGGSNVFIGHDAGLSNTTEASNTFVGASSNGAAGVTNATAIGANAVVTQSDSLVLGSGVKVGVGASAPKEKLHVLGGNILIDDSASGLILKSPNGLTCAKLTIDNAGALVTTVIPCP